MSQLKVLQTCPTQWKTLLQSLGVVDPSDDRMIAFDINKAEPCLPPSVAFQVPITINNVTIHRCIIDEGACTYVMSALLWKKLGSPELQLYTITLCAYDGHPCHPERFYQNIPIQLAGKQVLIDVEVVDALLDDYNTLLGRSYMYAMKVVAY